MKIAESFLIVYFFLITVQIVEVRKGIISIDEQWVCNTKSNCLECLVLSHCAWCNVPDDKIQKCYSPKLTKDYCENNTIIHEDYGLSLEDNAKCSCAGGKLDYDHCRPPGASNDVPECSGRGQCRCGRCMCDPKPDPDHPTKSVVGEYCEYDNYSCDGSDCNEGPYPLVPDSPDKTPASKDAEIPVTAA